MKSLLFVIPLLLVGVGCSKGPSVVKKTAFTYDWSQVVTVGNHSFIPLPIKHDKDNPGIVLRVLDDFEKNHPDLEVTSWRISQGFLISADNAGKADGLWVDHRPRKKENP
mgnify:CR=1 FL=1